MAFLYVFLGGGVGSIFRYAISRYMPYHTGFPYATLLANIVSSFILGYLFAWSLKGHLPVEYKLLLMTGFCGGFSTFSTFSLENQELWNQGQYTTLVTYILLSLFLGISAVFFGIRLAE